MEPVVEAAPAVEPAPAPKPSPRKDVAKAAPAIVPARQGSIDRERLAARGMIVPGTPVTGIAEEYRIVKRELIRNFGGAFEERGRALDFALIVHVIVPRHATMPRWMNSATSSSA